jgi:hypothetical protein
MVGMVIKIEKIKNIDILIKDEFIFTLKVYLKIKKEVNNFTPF